MNEHVPPRVRERRRARAKQHAREVAAVAAFNREGVDAACRALGAGEAEHWETEGDE